MWVRPMLPLFFLAALGARAQTAEACIPDGMARLELDPAYADDTAAPMPIRDARYEVGRRFGGDCENLAQIRMRFTTSDDRAPLEKLGYEIRALDGEEEEVVTLTGPRTGNFPGEVFTHYQDHDQDVDVTFEIVVVDLNGNRSEPATVRVQDDTFGCSASGGGAGGAAAGVLVLVSSLIGVRRRRSRVARSLVLAAIAASCAVSLAMPRHAEACSPPWPQAYELDPAYADDVTPPSPPGPIEDATIAIYRDGSGYAGYGCNGNGTIDIHFGASDDRTPESRLGFEWRVVAGGDARIAERSGAWSYGTSSVRIFFADEGQAFDLEIEILTVDLNGNRSAPLRMRIEEEAVDTGGCSASDSRASHAGAIVLVLACVVAAVGGRRRTR